MCRRVAQCAFADLGEDGKLEIYDELANIRRLAELDDESFAVVKKVLFDVDVPGRAKLAVIDAFQAGVLLEVLKDLLYQAYVRRGRLQQAMMVRRYFAEGSIERHAAAAAHEPLSAALESADPDARVPEQPHPAAVLAPVRPDARSSARCGTRAPGAASGS